MKSSTTCVWLDIYTYCITHEKIPDERAWYGQVYYKLGSRFHRLHLLLF